ncbi:MAG: hypothetical protein M0R80_02545 [Proteobacteria bacterium]|jgi:hypothetical protein|nr:hypothetical protein [Pseudomonadota bacterium]
MWRFSLLALVLLVGCKSGSVSPSITEDSMCEGKLEKIQCVPEDNSVTAVFFYFDDGRITKLRCYYNIPINLKLGVVNKIYYHPKYLTITHTSIGDGVETKMKVEKQK